MYDPLDNAECPGCGARSTLDLEHAYPLARSCHACHGWFLEGDTARRFLVEELGLDHAYVDGLLQTPGPRQRRCPACDRPMREVLLHRDDADICGSCRGTWLPPGAMERLSRGRYGRKPSSTSANTSVPSPFGPPPVSSPTNPFGPPPASPRTPTTSPPASPPEPVTTAPVPASTSSPAPPSVTVPEPVPPPPETSALPEPSSAATSSFGMRPQLHVGKAAPRSVPQQPLENAASRGTGVDRGFSLKLLVGCSAVVLLAILAVVGTLLVGGDKEEQAEVVVTSSSTTSTEKYGAYLRHYRFGGRNLDWWSARLTELAPGGAAADAKAYALTKARAERLGLVVDEKPGRVDVSLSEPLVARLLERLEVR